MRERRDNKRLPGRRKAQFFIIAAVVVALAIGRMSTLLAQGFLIDVSGDQAYSPHDVLGDVHSGLLEILEYSDNDTIIKDIQDYEHATGRILGRMGYNLDISYEISTHNTGSVTLVEDVNITAHLRGHNADLYDTITTNIFCLRADPDEDLCTYVNVSSGLYITRDQCCSRFGLCC